MTLFFFPALFLLAGGQPPANEPAPQPVVAAPEAKPEPKMICKYEHVTGSRLQKTKVCRPEGESGHDQDSALQRELNKVGSMPASPLSGASLGGGN